MTINHHLNNVAATPQPRMCRDDVEFDITSFF
jgi:hypothetical protein